MQKLKHYKSKKDSLVQDNQEFYLLVHLPSKLHLLDVDIRHNFLVSEELHRCCERFVCDMVDDDLLHRQTEREKAIVRDPLMEREASNVPSYCLLWAYQTSPI
jgi:hypothetical protein